jgi:hypothetical protein
MNELESCKLKTMNPSLQTRGRPVPELRCTELVEVSKEGSGSPDKPMAGMHQAIKKQIYRQMKNIFLTTVCIVVLSLGLRAQDCETGYCPAEVTVHHKAGRVSPVTGDITYGVIKVSLTGGNRCWITRNLGATVQPTAFTDSSDPSTGWYWQFNKAQGYAMTGTTRTPNTTWIASISETSDWTAGNDPCTLLLGSNWRLPTLTEWNELKVLGTNLSSLTWDAARLLKFSYTGALNGTAGLRVNAGTKCGLWSNSNYSATNGYSFGSDTTIPAPGMSSSPKTLAYPLRCNRTF